MDKPDCRDDRRGAAAIPVLKQAPERCAALCLRGRQSGRKPASCYPKGKRWQSLAAQLRVTQIHLNAILFGPVVPLRRFIAGKARRSLYPPRVTRQPKRPSTFRSSMYRLLFIAFSVLTHGFRYSAASCASAGYPSRWLRDGRYCLLCVAVGTIPLPTALGCSSPPD